MARFRYRKTNKQSYQHQGFSEKYKETGIEGRNRNSKQGTISPVFGQGTKRDILCNKNPFTNYLHQLSVPKKTMIRMYHGFYLKGELKSWSAYTLQTHTR
jgi:hypothetical protein